MAAKLVPLLIAAGTAAATTAISASAARRSAAQQKLALPLPTATRDDVRARVDRQDELRRRKGTSADILLGPAAGEATNISPKVLTGE